MLAESQLQAIICTSNLEVAKRFYREVLGLPYRGQSVGAEVFDVGGVPLRLSPVPSTHPSEHTVLGFAVNDLELVAGQLFVKGVRFERFPGFPHDDSGLVRLLDGTRVLWFRDPDGNLLSVVQYGTTPSGA